MTHSPRTSDARHGTTDDAAYARAVGDRLRRVRQSRGLSLQAVETASEKEFKSSVLGAYERGERSISVPRLQRLALLYGAPVDSLLPDFSPGAPHAGVDRLRDGPGETDLDARLQSVAAQDPALLTRYLRMIRSQRHGSGGGWPVSIRAEDVRALELLVDPPSSPAEG